MDSALQGAQLVTPRKNAWILRVSGAPKVPKPRKFHETCRPSPEPPPRRCDGSIDLQNRRDGSPGFRPGGAPVRAGSNRSTRFGDDFEGRKSAPSHETLCLFPRPPPQRTVFYSVFRATATGAETAAGVSAK